MTKTVGVFLLLLTAAPLSAQGRGQQTPEQRAEADRMIAAMKKTGKQLAINWPLRWVESHVTAKRLVDEGLIGELIEYLVSKGGDVMVVSRRGQTTVDMANGPVQRIPPFLETIALLEKKGAKNNHKCKSC